MTLPTFPIVVLGAGLQGSCITLELARRGREVLLLDRDPVPMNRASLRNEGKIHLGLIYANDPTFATAGMQLEGALCFRSLLARWIGPRANSLALSTPFWYLVASDSVLSPTELEAHYQALEARCRQILAANPEADYLGARPDRLFERVSSQRLSGRFTPDRLAAAYETAERAIDPHQLADLIRSAIDEHPRVRFLPSHEIREVRRSGDGFVISGSSPDGTFSFGAGQVVNATWENRMALDRTAGIESPPGWLHRLKYRVIARLPVRLRGGPSATMVLGRYGDVVIRADGTAYLSWYPSGLRGWTHDLRPPAHWDAACRGESDPENSHQIMEAILAGIEPWYPGVSDSEALLVDAGVIVAHGRTDVDDPSSGLHDRTRVGVASFEGYHSVDPGKLTTAPLFAMRAAERVMSRDEVPVA